MLVGLAPLPPVGLLAYDTVETRARERRPLHNQALYQAQLVARPKISEALRGLKPKNERSGPPRCGPLRRQPETKPS
jgi:hypothetical protein